MTKSLMENFIFRAVSYHFCEAYECIINERITTVFIPADLVQITFKFCLIKVNRKLNQMLVFDIA